MGAGFTFGLYAAQQVSSASGPTDDPAAIQDAIRQLRGAKTFIVREYIHFRGREASGHEFTGLTLPDAFYAQPHIQLDLALSYLPSHEDIDGWLAFVKQAIARYGPLTKFLQITVEPNFSRPALDGSRPGVRLALTKGMINARQWLDQTGLNHVQLGFSVAEPQAWNGGDGDFWPAIAELGGQAFVDVLGYVGLAFYPDAFSPVAPLGQPGDIASLTEHALKTLRQVSLPQARIPATLPVHLVETGSPTDSRNELEQAQSLEAIVRSVWERRETYNVTALEWFGLRDADSQVSSPFHQFGLLRDNYMPKLAFDRLRQLVAELD